MSDQQTILSDQDFVNEIQGQIDVIRDEIKTLKGDDVFKRDQLVYAMERKLKILYAMEVSHGLKPMLKPKDMNEAIRRMVGKRWEIKA
jgi:hypothetical protein